jgi:secreted trypsin-like serine protease
MQVTIPINSDSTCAFSIYDPLTQICAGDINLIKGSCRGDSGGPLMKQVDGSWTLVGIVSYGDIGCSGFGVYTKVSAYYDWITTNNKPSIPIKTTTAVTTSSFLPSTCGIPEVSPTTFTRIINGFEAIPHSWPVKFS